MFSLTVSRESGRPLAAQIVAGIKRQIDDRHLRPGARLPSIRNLAQSCGVSRFTVVEAYDRLVASGYVRSRRGAGFYTAPAPARAARPVPSDGHKRNEELVWLIRRLLDADENALLAGGPWLPNSWLDETGIRQGLNALARRNGAYLLEYGCPFGYLPLREHLALMLAGLGITAHPGQILLTQGASQALELVGRHLLKPGDAALVDDPGYYNLFGNLRLQGIEMLAVPRHPDGPDMAVLEKLALARRPKAYFTQSAMQNPTGTGMDPCAAFRVLEAAGRHGFTIVEDDIFCDLQAEPTPRLATLDRLDRVIYVRSFSKTLSGSLRVGFVACREDTANDLADIKMLTSITTSQFTERLVYLMLVDGHYRKHLSRLQERLGEARLDVARAFERIGLEAFVEPRDGMFVWARFPHVEDSMRLAKVAQQDGVVLAPGTVFRPHLEPSPWMRFNVAVCDNPRVQDRLERLGMTPAAPT
ncbi:MAG: PLP-dependent aminotransferase family protein [Geminicoccaceae bacterium]|nr:PLP-dependent aminotransferase family protein [Geminicoccaceae bacterium]